MSLLHSRVVARDLERVAEVGAGTMSSLQDRLQQERLHHVQRLSHVQFSPEILSNLQEVLIEGSALDMRGERV